MIPKIRVYLVIRGEEITLEILDRLNTLGATECWTKNQRRLPLLSYADNGCRFSSESEKSYYADEVAIIFLKKLIESNHELFDFILEHDLRPMLYIAAFFFDVVPSFVVEANNVQLLAKFNISISVDFMQTSDDED